MPKHQQIQQSKKPDTTSQNQSTPVSQTPVSNPYSIIQRAKINPKSLTHADVMQLQRTIGNRAVGRLLSGIGNTSTAQQEAVQRQEIPEEEEPLQGKFENKPEIACPSCFVSPIVQRQEIPEEEEPLQGKMIGTVQRQEIPEGEEPLQTKKENNTGMPDNLKAGVENLSGIDMSDVRVQYNSSKPADVGALAYTQGTNIHVAPGQEKHLPHEGWHVVQQAQGRVKPTVQLKDGIQVNDDEGLEQEADTMGAKAQQILRSEKSEFGFPIYRPVTQRKIVEGVFATTETTPAHQVVQMTGWEKDKSGNFFFIDPKRNVTWYWKAGIMWYQSKNPQYENGSGEENAKSFEEWYRLSNYDSTLLIPYVTENQQVLPKGYDGQEYKLLYFILKNTSISYEEIRKKNPFSQLPQYKTIRFVETVTGKEDPKEQERRDLLAGENYLSSDYRRINPLLLAFSKVGYTPSEVRNPLFNFREREAEVLSAWKKIAIERGYADEHLVSAWGEDHLQATYDIFKSINRVWIKFKKPTIPNNVVCRGDSKQLYDSFQFLNPKEYPYDGEFQVTKTVEWPAIMSTTIGNPKEHNYIQSKMIIWQITVTDDHEGRVIGENNKSEQEVTFPVGTRLQITKLLIRKNDKLSNQAKFNDYGGCAEVIVTAKVISRHAVR